MPGTPITRGKFVWPGGLGGCRTGHGCSSWGSKQLKACVEQNYKNQRPEGPAWCIAPDSWAALCLASCQAYVAAALTPPISAGLNTWAPPRPCHTGLGIPSSVDIPPKTTQRKSTRSCSHPLRLFLELETETQSKVTCPKSRRN